MWSLLIEEAEDYHCLHAPSGFKSIHLTNPVARRLSVKDEIHGWQQSAGTDATTCRSVRFIFVLVILRKRTILLLLPEN